MKLPYSAKSVDFPFVYIYIYIFFFFKELHIYIYMHVRNKGSCLHIFVFIVHLKVKYNVTDIFKLHEIDPSRSPTLEFSKQKFRRIADYIYIYSDTQQATHARNRFGQSISSINPSVHASCIHISCRPFFHRSQHDWLIAYIARYHLIVMCGKQCMIPPNTSAWHASLHRIAATVPWI